MAVFEQPADAADDVVGPALREVDDAAVDDDVRVRPVEAEEVREAGHGDAEVGARVAVPALVQVGAAAAGDLHRRQELRGVEARAVDDDVDLVLDAVGGHDPDWR